MPLGAFRLNSIAKVLATAPAAVTWDDPYTIREAAMFYDSSAQTGATANKGVFVGDSGTKLYVMDQNDVIYQYTLSTAYDITSASYATKSFSTAAEGDIKEDFWISSDGTRLFQTGRSLDSVRSYTMSTAWDISTASYDSKSLDVSAKETAPRALTISSDGSELYVSGTTSDDIHQYTMSTPFDLSTASFTGTKDTSGESVGSVYSMEINGDGTQIFIWDGSGSNLQEYNLSTAYDITSASAGTSMVRDYNGTWDGMHILPDGSNVYVANLTGQNDYYISQYKLNSGITFNSDANASSLALALPYAYKETGLDDCSNIINTSITKNINWDGGHPDSRATMVSGTYKFSAYGGSSQFDQTGSLINGIHATSYDVSVNGRPGSFGAASSATYTVEMYVRATDATTNNNWCLSSGDSGGRWLFGFATHSSTSYGNENNIGLGDSNWHHIAIVNGAGTHRFYIDGNYDGAWYSVNTGFSVLHVGEFTASGGANFRGNIQDLRVYIGLAKYSGTSGSGDYTPPGAMVSSFS